MLSIAVLSVFYVSFIIDNSKKVRKKRKREETYLVHHHLDISEETHL